MFNVNLPVRPILESKLLVEIGSKCYYLPNALAALAGWQHSTDHKISLSVSQSVCTRVQRSTGRNLPPTFTKLAIKVVSQEMWLSFLSVEIGISGINFLPLLWWKITLNVKYVENGERCDVGRSGGQLGNHLWAFNWHYELWPGMTLKCPSSRSLKLHIKYFENGDRYDDVVSGSRIGNMHAWAIDC